MDDLLWITPKTNDWSRADIMDMNHKSLDDRAIERREDDRRRFSARTRVKRQAGSGRPVSSPRSDRSGDGYYEEPVFDLDGDRQTPEYVGRVVRHPKFGRGMVLRQEGEGDEAKCEVRFMGQITKKIMARFLDIEDEDGA